MKAEFNENGTLIIKAENYTESFALEHWNKSFNISNEDLENGKEKYRSTLIIDWNVNKE